MFAIIAANHYRSVRLITVANKTAQVIESTKNRKPPTKKQNFGRKLDLVAPVCSQNQRVVEKILKNNTNGYCFKGTSRMGMELIRTDQIEKRMVNSD